ncbi:MAG: Abi family protein [Clostridia bacterium]|nr:Abi family protein [Clostridia bacterium]
MIVLQTPARPATGGVPAGAPLSLCEDHRMSKPFLSFREQIELLQKEKNLLVLDPSYAESLLCQIGYFGLIGGYKQPFKNKTTKKYKDGTRFEDIVTLYYFDERLRELFLKYILKIERHVRSLLSYYFTQKYGVEQEQYLDHNNYQQTQRTRESIPKLIEKLDELANTNSDYPYINHQRTAYGNVPLWVLVNGLSMGTLSKFYMFTTQDIQSRIAQHFDRVDQRKLGRFLKVMTKFRNVCAHGERLYAYKTRDTIPDTQLHKSLNIPKCNEQHAMGKCDLFSVVIVFRYLLTSEDFDAFQTDLSAIIQTYLKTPGSLGETTLYESMGFPANWEAVTAAKK